jgi:hypothetical protein
MVLVLNSLPGCGGACGDPDGVRVEGDVGGTVVVDWEHSNAMGLYFTEPDAKLPGGPNDLVEGYSYWVVEATSFPGGFGPPVTYGKIPKKAKDATEEHGGMPGGEPLECGVTYKVAVVALRGEAETFVEWDCDH